MKLTKCNNKHFYDADQFDRCPHCEKAGLSQPPPQAGPERHSGGVPSPAPVSASKSTSQRRAASSHTGSIWAQGEDVRTGRLLDEFNDAGMPEEVLQQAETAASNILHVPPHPAEEPKIVEPTPTPLNSLQSQVNAVSSHASSDDVNTMAFYNFTDTEPVVGWLVCIKGEYFGQSFNLKAGQNFIGRSLTMDVPLAKDTSVSRNKHAIITYDPQNRVFYIQPGESSGLTYLNGGLVLAYQPIKVYDKIKVGNSELMFFACCSEHFSWEDFGGANK